MPLYDYRCDRCGQTYELRHGMGERPEKKCCLRELRRVFTAPNFQEDRTRFWRARDGSRFNIQLGTQMPESRQGFREAVAAVGGEAVSWNERPAHFKRAQEYAEHVQRGGERLSSKEVMQEIGEPCEPSVSVDAQLDAIGYRRDEAMAKARAKGLLIE